jgi:type IV pilus assembly protein PilN
MIRINLLPHRELARKKKKELFFVHLGFALLAGAAISAAIYTFFDLRISAQQQRNEFIRAEIRQLDAQIRDINTLQQEINALRSRQAAVEGLQADRNLPVHLLDEMVAQLPEGVYLRNLRQEDMAITLTGVAQSQERVSELLRNLSTRSEWLTQPQLVEITSAMVTLSQRDQRRVFNFSIRVTLTRGPSASASTPDARL